MKERIYAIYDNKIQEHVQKYFARNDGEATRIFGDAVNQPDSQLNQHAEDFALFRIGTFNTHNGEISAEEHKNLGLAVEYKKDDGT